MRSFISSTSSSIFSKPTIIIELTDDTSFISFTLPEGVFNLNFFKSSYLISSSDLPALRTISSSDKIIFVSLNFSFITR